MAKQRRSLRDPNRPPAHPGAFLEGVVLEGGSPTKTELASALGISRQMLHGILTGKHAVTAEMAVRLGYVLGGGAEIWLRMQRAYDLWHAERTVDTSKLRALYPAAKAA
jgi:addiction module HigA family antidote